MEAVYKHKRPRKQEKCHRFYTFWTFSRKFGFLALMFMSQDVMKQNSQNSHLKCHFSALIGLGIDCIYKKAIFSKRTRKLILKF